MLYRDADATGSSIDEKEAAVSPFSRLQKEFGIKSDIDDKDVKLFALDSPFGKKVVADLYKAASADQIEQLTSQLLSNAYDASPAFQNAVHKSNLGQIPDPEKLKAAIATSPITQSVKTLIDHMAHKTKVFYSGNNAPRLVGKLITAIRAETEAPFGKPSKKVAPLSNDELRGFNTQEKDLVPEITEREIKKAIAYFLGKDIEGHIDAENKFVKTFKNKFTDSLTEDQKKDRIHRLLTMVKAKKPDATYLKGDLRAKAEEYYAELSALKESSEVIPDEKMKLLFGVTNKDLKDMNEKKASDVIAYYFNRKVDYEDGKRQVSRLSKGEKGENTDHIDAIAEMSTIEQLKILHSFLEQLKAERAKAGIDEDWLKGDLNKLTQSFVKSLVVEEKLKLKERDTQLIKQDSERMVNMIDSMDRMMHTKEFDEEGKIIGDITLKGTPTDEEISPYVEKIKKEYADLKMPEAVKRRIVKVDKDHMSYVPISESTIKTELDEAISVHQENKIEINKNLQKFKEKQEKGIPLSNTQNKEIEELTKELNDAEIKIKNIRSQEPKLMKLIADPGVQKLSSAVSEYITFLEKKKQTVDGLLKFKDARTFDALIERFHKFSKEFSRVVVGNTTFITLLGKGHHIHEFPKGIGDEDQKSTPKSNNEHDQYRYKELDNAQLKGKSEAEVEKIRKEHEALYHPLVKYFGENKYLDKIKKVLQLVVDGKTLSHLDAEQITDMVNQMKDRIEDIKKATSKYRPDKLHSQLIDVLKDKANIEKIVKPKKEKTEKKASISHLIRKIALELREKEKPNWLVYGEKYRLVGGEVKKQYTKSFFDKPDYVNSFIDALAARGFKFFSEKGQEISDPTQYDPKIDDIVAEVLLKGASNIEEKVLNKVGTDRILRDNRKDAQEEVVRGNRDLQKFEAAIVKAKDQYLPQLEEYAKFFNRPDEAIAEAAKEQGLSGVHEELTLKKKRDLGLEDGLRQLQEAIIKKDVAKVKELVNLERSTLLQDPKKAINDEADIMKAEFKPLNQTQTDPLAKKVLKELSDRFRDEWKVEIGEAAPDREKVREEMKEKERDVAVIFDRNSVKKLLIKFFDSYVDYKRKLPEGLTREEMAPVQDPVKNFLSGPSKTVIDRGLTPEEMENRNAAMEALKAKYEKAQKTFTYLRGQEVLKESDIKAFKSIESEMEDNKEATNEALEDLNKTIEATKKKFKADVETYTKAVDFIKSNKDNFKEDKDYESSINKAREITKNIKAYKDELDSLTKKYDTVKVAHDKALEELKRIRATIYNEIPGIERDIADLLKKFKELQKELRTLSAKKLPPNAIKTPESEYYEKRMEKIKSEIEALRNKYKELTNSKSEVLKIMPLSEEEIGLPEDKKLDILEGPMVAVREVQKDIDILLYKKGQLQRELDSLKTMKIPPSGKLQAVTGQIEELKVKFSDLMGRKMEALKKVIPSLERERQELEAKKPAMQKDPTKAKELKAIDAKIKSIESNETQIKVQVAYVTRKGLTDLDKYLEEREKQAPQLKLAGGAEDMGGEDSDVRTIELHQMPMQKVGPKEMPEYKKVELQTQMPEPKVKDWDVVQYLFGQEKAKSLEDISRLQKGIGDIADVEVLKQIVNEINRKQNDLEKRGKFLDLKVKIGNKTVAVKEAGTEFRDLLEKYQKAVNDPLIKRNNLIPRIEKARSRLKAVAHYVDEKTGKFREFNKEEKEVFVRLFYKQLFWDLMGYWKTKVGKSALFGGREMAPFSRVFDTFKNVAGVKSNPVISGQLNNIANEFKAKDSTYTRSRFTELKKEIKDFEDGMKLVTKGSAKYNEYAKEKEDKQKELEHLDHLKKQKDILMRKMMDTADTGFLVSVLSAINKKIATDNAKEQEMIEKKKKELEEKKGETYEIITEIQPEPIEKGKAPTRPEMKLKAPKLDMETLKGRLSENLSYKQLNKIHEVLSAYKDMQTKDAVPQSTLEKAKVSMLVSLSNIFKEGDMEKTFEQYKDTISNKPEAFQDIMDDLVTTEKDITDSISKVVEDIPNPDKAVKSLDKALAQISREPEGSAGRDKLVGQLVDKIEELFESSEQSFTFKKVKEMIQEDPTLFITQMKKRLQKMEELTKKEAYWHDKNFNPKILYGKRMQSLIAALLEEQLYEDETAYIDA